MQSRRPFGQKELKMNKQRKDGRTALAAVLLLALAALAGCGGGGGGGGILSANTALVAPVAQITCANGDKVTGAATNCPDAKVVSTTVANGSVVDSDTFAGITIQLDSTLDASSITAANVALKAGNAATGSLVAGTVSPAGTKGFSFTPAASAKLQYGGPYVFTVRGVKETLGNPIPEMSVAFTTAVKQCNPPAEVNAAGTDCITPVPVAVIPPAPATPVAPPVPPVVVAPTPPVVVTPPPVVPAPPVPPVVTPKCSDPQQVWMSGIDVCAYPMGVVVTNPKPIPTGCTWWKDQCWKDAVANGTVKWVVTPAIAKEALYAFQKCPIVGAYFTNGLGFDELTFFCSDTGAIYDGFGIDSSRVSLKMTSVEGTSKGIMQTYSDGSRYEIIWFPSTTLIGISSNIWSNVRR